MPTVFTLFVVKDHRIVKQPKIKLSGNNAERLLRQDAVLIEELIYFTNASVEHCNWDYVQIIGSDGGLLKHIDNRQNLGDNCKHPKLKPQCLVHLEPTM